MGTVMPAEEILDEDALLAPIPGDEPAGGPVPYTDKDQLDTLRKEDDPNSYADDDPMRPTEFKRADWPAIIRLATKVLTTSSKDLLIACRLTEALTKVHGFAGLKAGLRLLRRLCEEAWDRIRPEMDDPTDLEARAAPFNWLGEADKGARFAGTVRGIPMFAGEEGPVGWVDWRKGQDPKFADRREAFEKAAQVTCRADTQALVDKIDAVIQELTALLTTLSTKMGPVAPTMPGLRQALAECHTLAGQVLARKPPEVGSAPTEAEATTPSASGDGLPVQGRLSTSSPATRAEIYRRMAELAQLLQQLEPHSPIPYLIQRACELGAKPFPQLMKALIRDESVLGELTRELGLPSEE
jgi:type VI secretion system protein ImpA